MIECGYAKCSRSFVRTRLKEISVILAIVSHTPLNFIDFFFAYDQTLTCNFEGYFSFL